MFFAQLTWNVVLWRSKEYDIKHYLSPLGVAFRVSFSESGNVSGGVVCSKWREPASLLQTNIWEETVSDFCYCVTILSERLSYAVFSVEVSTSYPTASYCTRNGLQLQVGAAWWLCLGVDRPPNLLERMFLFSKFLTYYLPQNFVCEK